MNFRFSAVSAAAFMALQSPCTLAQISAAPVTLAPVIVSSQGAGDEASAGAAINLSGNALAQRRASTLGETLDGLPGVSSTGFGPNASRPVLRGQSGDRARILDNGGAMSDASGLSDDHAVAFDPLSLERVEVIRGSAVLLHGGSPVGGVVNLVDNRISPQALFDAKGGVSAQADVSVLADRANHAASALLETGTDQFTLHLDAFDRTSPDTRSRAAVCETSTGTLYKSNRICNSASSASGGGVGATLHFDQGHIGLAQSSVLMNYGTVAEPAVTIGLRNDKTRLSGEWRFANTWLESLRWQWGYSRYRHTEFDAGAPQTTFAQQSHDARAELRHASLAGWKGTLGWQQDDGHFAADGSEAYAPYSRTRKQAWFAHEERAMPWGKLEAAARVEDVRVASLGNASVARLNSAVGERQFKPLSLSGGATWKLSSTWESSATLASAQRAPKDSELYANGPHAATNVYEVGNANLGLERSRSLEWGLKWKAGEHLVKASVFENRVSHYISLQDSGIKVSANGDPETAPGSGVSAAGDPANLPRYVYTATTARFRGLEFNGTHPLAMPALPAAGKWFTDWRADLIRADNLGTGEPLPRIAPVRVGASLRMERGPVQAQLGFDHSMAQTRVPAGQQATGGYTLWHLRGSVQLRRDSSGQLSAYARLENLGNVHAFSATSVLTQTAPGKSPLAGRSLTLGLRYGF